MTAFKDRTAPALVISLSAHSRYSTHGTAIDDFLLYPITDVLRISWRLLRDLCMTITSTICSFVRSTLIFLYVPRHRFEVLYHHLCICTVIYMPDRVIPASPAYLLRSAAGNKTTEPP